MSEALYALVGIAPCGCIRWARCVYDDDSPIERTEADTATGAAIAVGYSVKVWPIDRLRASNWKCSDSRCSFRKEAA